MARAPLMGPLRPANLWDFLVRAKLPAVDRRHGAGHWLQPGFKKCGKTSVRHTQGRTPAPWPARPGQSSRLSPVTTPPVLVELDNASENQLNMWGKWGPQGLLETDAPPLGHWSGQPLQPSWPWPCVLQPFAIWENSKLWPLCYWSKWEFLDRKIWSGGGRWYEQEELRRFLETNTKGRMG